MKLQDLHETTELPVLVDGRDIFLQRNERIMRAVWSDEGGMKPRHVFVSSLDKPFASQSGRLTYIETFELGAPSQRLYTTAQLRNLQPYPEDAKLWQELVLGDKV